MIVLENRHLALLALRPNDPMYLVPNQLVVSNHRPRSLPSEYRDGSRKTSRQCHSVYVGAGS